MTDSSIVVAVSDSSASGNGNTGINNPNNHTNDHVAKNIDLAQANLPAPVGTPHSTPWFLWIVLFLVLILIIIIILLFVALRDPSFQNKSKKCGVAATTATTATTTTTTPAITANNSKNNTLLAPLPEAIVPVPAAVAAPVPVVTPVSVTAPVPEPVTTPVPVMVPAPVIPTPVMPVPVPAPVIPAPVIPVPVMPVPVMPVPVIPAPVIRVPVTPVPVMPTPPAAQKTTTTVPVTQTQTIPRTIVPAPAIPVTSTVPINNVIHPTPTVPQPQPPTSVETPTPVEREREDKDLLNRFRDARRRARMAEAAGPLSACTRIVTGAVFGAGSVITTVNDSVPETGSVIETFQEVGTVCSAQTAVTSYAEAVARAGAGAVARGAVPSTAMTSIRQPGAVVLRQNRARVRNDLAALQFARKTAVRRGRMNRLVNDNNNTTVQKDMFMSPPKISSIQMNQGVKSISIKGEYFSKNLKVMIGRSADDTYANEHIDKQVLTKNLIVCSNVSENENEIAYLRVVNDDSQSCLWSWGAFAGAGTAGAAGPCPHDRPYCSFAALPNEISLSDSKGPSKHVHILCYNFDPNNSWNVSCQLQLFVCGDTSNSQLINVFSTQPIQSDQTVLTFLDVWSTVTVAGKYFLRASCTLTPPQITPQNVLIQTFDSCPVHCFL